MPDLRPLRLAQTATQLFNAKHLKKQPVWLPTLLRTPPSTDFSKKLSPIDPHARSRNGKVRRIFEPQRIAYMEDQLRARFYKEHPWELARPVLLEEGETSGFGTRSGTMAVDWSSGIVQPGRRVSGESVVQRQRHLMTQERRTCDDAYLLACTELYAARTHEAIASRVAVEEALAFGAVFHASHMQVGLELERDVLARWRERALHAKSLVQPGASSSSSSKTATVAHSTLVPNQVGGKGRVDAIETDVMDELLR